MSRVKRTVSVIFVFLMVMNSIGYYAVLTIVRDDAAIASSEKIHSNLNEPGGSLIVKAPLNAPYRVNSESYDITGVNFTYEGKVYQALSGKIHEDTLYVVCIQDARTTEANQTLNQYARSFAGDQGKDGKVFKLTLSFAKYYMGVASPVQSSNTGWMIERSFAKMVMSQGHDLHIRIFHPPQQVS